jgi:hypothetical protein
VSQPETICYLTDSQFNFAAFAAVNQSILPAPDTALQLMNVSAVVLDEVNDTVISFLRYEFRYSAELKIVSATRTAFLMENETRLRVSVSFEPEAAGQVQAPKSGEVGYAVGRPIIAGTVCDGEDRICVSPDDGSSFPIPFGVDCSKVQYTPLHFGVDILGGCTGGWSENLNLSDYRYFAIHGQPNPNSTKDWVSLVDSENSTISTVFFLLREVRRCKERPEETDFGRKDLPGFSFGCKR